MEGTRKGVGENKLELRKRKRSISTLMLYKKSDYTKTSGIRNYLLKVDLTQRQTRSRYKDGTGWRKLVDFDESILG